jgi:hypothetical protein
VFTLPDIGVSFSLFYKYYNCYCPRVFEPTISGFKTRSRDDWISKDVDVYSMETVICPVSDNEYKWAMDNEREKNYALYSNEVAFSHTNWFC